MIEARKGCIKGIRYDAYCDMHNKQFKHCDQGLEEACRKAVEKALSRENFYEFYEWHIKIYGQFAELEADEVLDYLRIRVGIDPQKEET